MTRDELVTLTFWRLKQKNQQMGVDRAQLYMLVPLAMDRLSEVASMQPNLRHRLTALFSLSVESGQVDLTQSGAEDLHRGSLLYSTLYGPDDTAEQYPYVFKEYRTMDGYLDPLFGYYALRGNSLILRTPGATDDATSSLTGTVRLYALKIPFVGAGVLPDSGELIQLASDLLANEYLKLAPAPAA